MTLEMYLTSADFLPLHLNTIQKIEFRLLAWSAPKKVRQNATQKLCKQLKGYVVCELQAADPLALPWSCGCYNSPDIQWVPVWNIPRIEIPVQLILYRTPFAQGICWCSLYGYCQPWSEWKMRFVPVGILKKALSNMVGIILSIGQSKMA